MTDKKLFFCGIGGSGMSALAMYCQHIGYSVAGSDRNHDQGKLPLYYNQLKNFGIELYSQNGDGVTQDVSKLIASSAVETQIPDIQKAKEKDIPIQLRAALLAEIFNTKKGIAVAGTSGKSTTTAMIAHILRQIGQEPNVINGAVMLNAQAHDGLGNTYFGKSDLLVIEADESDGSIAYYQPHIAVLNNISFDHKPLPELRSLFKEFLQKAKHGAVLNMDDSEVIALIDAPVKKITYSLSNPKADLTAQHIHLNGFQSTFKVKEFEVKLNVPGLYNIQNALAALSTILLLDLDLQKACEALSSFLGTKRRMQIIGNKNDLIVIDDFAHNADKIKASLTMLQSLNIPLHVIFQPHGFTPTLQQKEDLISTFSSCLQSKDSLYIPEIYFAGGTVEKKISSKDLTDHLSSLGKKAFFHQTRNEIIETLIQRVKTPALVIVMGARDDTLTQFSQDIFDTLSSRDSTCAIK